MDQFTSNTDQSTPSAPGGQENLWDRLRRSPIFPVLSIVIVGVVILGIGFAVVGLVSRFGTTPGLGPVKGPSNVTYKSGGDAELKLNVLRAAYADSYGDQKPLAPGRKLVVVNFEIHNVGKGPSNPFTNEDMRLFTPDNSKMPPAGWSKGFLSSGVGPGQTIKGDVVFDIDERNAQKPLNLYNIGFGRNPGSLAMYPLAAQ